MLCFPWGERLYHVNYPIKIPQANRETIPDREIISAITYDKYPKQNTRAHSIIVLCVKVLKRLNARALMNPTLAPTITENMHRYKNEPRICTGVKPENVE